MNQRPVRIFLLVAIVFAAMALIGSFTTGTPAYVTAGVVLFVLVALGSPLALANFRREASVAERRERELTPSVR